MSGGVETSARSEGDLIEAALWIAADSPQAAERFLTAAQETFLWLARTPGAGRRIVPAPLKLAELRWWPVNGFRNYLVFYMPTPEGVKVIRVLHRARNIAAILQDE